MRTDNSFDFRRRRKNLMNELEKSVGIATEIIVDDDTIAGFYIFIHFRNHGIRLCGHSHCRKKRGQPVQAALFLQSRNQSFGLSSDTLLPSSTGTPKIWR